jgi:hypothetical protein
VKRDADVKSWKAEGERRRRKKKAEGTKAEARRSYESFTYSSRFSGPAQSPDTFLYLQF